MSNDLTYNGTAIHMTGERLSLTDMWRAAGADPNKQPAKWREHPSTKEFASHVAAVTLRVEESDLFRVQNGGKNPGTWAHWQIGLAYAKYLSPDFHVWANTVVRERMEGKPVPASFDPHVFGGIVKSVVGKQIKDAILELAPQIIAAQMAVDPRIAAVDAIPALQVAIDAKVPASGRRPIVRAISNSLARHCEAKGHVIRRDARGTKLYPLVAAHEWRLSGGDALIRKLVAQSTPIGPLFAIPGGKA